MDSPESAAAAAPGLAILLVIRDGDVTEELELQMPWQDPEPPTVEAVAAFLGSLDLLPVAAPGDGGADGGEYGFEVGFSAQTEVYGGTLSDEAKLHSGETVPEDCKRVVCRVRTGGGRATAAAGAAAPTAAPAAAGAAAGAAAAFAQTAPAAPLPAAPLRAAPPPAAPPSAAPPPVAASRPLPPPASPPPLLRSLMDSLLQSPEILQRMLEANPQLVALRDQNPELNRLLNDPDLLRQSIQAVQNPGLMREIMTNTDRALSNIDAVPGGFNALHRLYRTMQEPMWNATVGGLGARRAPASNNEYTLEIGENDAPKENVIPNPWARRPPPPPLLRQAPAPPTRPIAATTLRPRAPPPPPPGAAATAGAPPTAGISPRAPLRPQAVPPHGFAAHSPPPPPPAPPPAAPPPADEAGLPPPQTTSSAAPPEAATAVAKAPDDPSAGGEELTALVEHPANPAQTERDVPGRAEKRYENVNDRDRGGGAEPS